MMRLDEAIERRYSLGQKLWWLILGPRRRRSFSFVARAIWVHGGNVSAWPQTLSPLFIVAGLTALYVLARTFSKVAAASGAYSIRHRHHSGDLVDLDHRRHSFAITLLSTSSSLPLRVFFSVPATPL